MTTGRIIVKKAMQKAGILTMNEEPQADEANDVLDAINNMLSSWSNDSMKIVSRVRESFSLVGGTNTYTIGTGQTFSTTRPIQIVDAYYTLGGIDYPLIRISDEQYDALTSKDIQGLPKFVNYDNGYPTGRLRFYPTPSTSLTLNLLSEKEITAIALNDDISFPPGWERALIYNGAVEIASEFGAEVSANTSSIAASSKRAIMRAIMKARPIDVPTGSVVENIYTGYTR